MQRIVFIAEKNKKPEAFAGTAMIFPRFEDFPKYLSSGIFFLNYHKILIFQKTLQLWCWESSVVKKKYKAETFASEAMIFTRKKGLPRGLSI